MKATLAFGALLAGAVIIDYGVKNVKGAFASGGSTTSAPGPYSLPGAGAVDSSAKLNANQAAFAKRLNANTGLDPKVISAWILNEEPASASHAPNGANNWLNIGAFDNGGWAYGGASVWDDPTKAADATASFILGHPVNGVRPPAYGSQSIRNIIKSVGKGVKAQAAAIAGSDWASSHYAGGPIGQLANG